MVSLKLKDGTTFEEAECIHAGTILSCRLHGVNIYEAAEKFTESNCGEITIIRTNGEESSEEVVKGYSLHKISTDGIDKNGTSINLKGGE